MDRQVRYIAPFHPPSRRIILIVAHDFVCLSLCDRNYQLHESAAWRQALHAQPRRRAPSGTLFGAWGRRLPITLTASLGARAHREGAKVATCRYSARPRRVAAALMPRAPEFHEPPRRPYRVSYGTPEDSTEFPPKFWEADATHRAFPPEPGLRQLSRPNLRHPRNLWVSLTYYLAP